MREENQPLKSAKDFPSGCLTRGFEEYIFRRRKTRRQEMELPAETILPAGSLFERRTTYLIHTQVNDARVNYPAGGSNYVSNQRAT
jgi:hypothetical protein